MQQIIADNVVQKQVQTIEVEKPNVVQGTEASATQIDEEVAQAAGSPQELLNSAMWGREGRADAHVAPRHWDRLAGHEAAQLVCVAVHSA